MELRNVSVNLSSDTVSFKYDPNILKIGEVKKVVEKKPDDIGQGNLITEAFEESRHEKEGCNGILQEDPYFLRPSLLLADMNDGRFSLPAIIDPHLNPLNFAIVQLILTIPNGSCEVRWECKSLQRKLKYGPLVGLGTERSILGGGLRRFK